MPQPTAFVAFGGESDAFCHSRAPYVWPAEGPKNVEIVEIVEIVEHH